MFGDTRVPYDKSAAIWSPEGELVQLSYARRASERGATSIGLILDDKTILLAAETKSDPILLPSRKIQMIDDNMFLIASGLSSDSNLLTQQARIRAQNHLLIYGQRIGPKGIAMTLGDIMARSTLTAGFRPFGASLLIAGFHPLTDKSEMFFVDNGGTYFGVRAYATGSGYEAAQAVLRDKYKDGLTVDEGKELSIAALRAALSREEISVDDVEFKVLKLE